MFTLPPEVKQKIFSCIVDATFQQNAPAMANVEVSQAARRLSSPLKIDSSLCAKTVEEYTDDCRSLALISLVSREFYRALIPMLYRCILIEWDEREVLLEATLRRNANIASLVRAIIVKPSRWGGLFEHMEIIQSIINHCTCLEALQDHTIYPHPDEPGVAEQVKLPLGIQLKKITACLSVFRQAFNTPSILSNIVSLELVATEREPLQLALSLPVLKELKVALDDRSLHKCSFPSLQHLYIESGLDDYPISEDTLASALSFFRSWGKRVTLLSFKLDSICANGGGRLVALESVFPSIRCLLLGTNPRPDWIPSTWNIPFFDVSLGHPKVVTVVLNNIYNISGYCCLSAEIPAPWRTPDPDLNAKIIEDLGSLNRSSFPHLKTIRIMTWTRSSSWFDLEQLKFFEAIKQRWEWDGIVKVDRQ